MDSFDYNGSAIEIDFVLVSARGNLKRILRLCMISGSRKLPWMIKISTIKYGIVYIDMHARTYYYIIQSPIRRVSMQALGVKPGGKWECRGAPGRSAVGKTGRLETGRSSDWTLLFRLQIRMFEFLLEYVTYATSTFTLQSVLPSILAYQYWIILMSTITLPYIISVLAQDVTNPNRDLPFFT